MLPLCLLAPGLSLRGRAADTNVRVSRWFCCCCTRGAVGFIFATTLVFMIGHICIIFAQLPHGLQLSPVIAAESRLRRGIAGQVLVHAVWLFWQSRLSRLPACDDVTFFPPFCKDAVGSGAA